MRFDRFLTERFFAPVRKKLGYQKNCIPILMYHSISATLEKNGNPYYGTTTAPDIFKQHMELIHRDGYDAILLDDLKTKLGEGASGKSVVITFDDGFRDFYTAAYPVLQKYGFRATVFLPTAFIGGNGESFKERQRLNWQEISELREYGMNFGAHTVTHPQLKHLSSRAIEYEIRTSKETIETKLGEPVTAFAYPYAFPEEDGKFTVHLRNLLIEAGYQYAVTTCIGTVRKSAGSFFLKRIPVNSHDDPVFFRAKLEGGYDWLHAVQLCFKKIKKIGKQR